MNIPISIAAEIAALRAEFDRPDDDGVVLVGSFARGTAGPHSDLDLTWFRAGPTAERHQFFARGTRLVSLMFTTVAEAAAQLARPDAAIWAVRGLGDMHILSDNSGAIAALRIQAASLEWTGLQPAADLFASAEVAAFGEEASKLLNALAATDEYAATNAATWLWLGLAKVMAVHLGVLMTSENSWLAVVEGAAGSDTLWAKWFRRCAGLDPTPAGTSPALWRADAGVRLYRETARRLGHAIQAPDQHTIATVCAYIDRWLANHAPMD